MTANQLVKILKTLPEGSFDVIVHGRELNGGTKLHVQIRTCPPIVGPAVLWERDMT